MINHGIWGYPATFPHFWPAQEQLIKELHGKDNVETVETLAVAQEAGEKLMELSQKIGLVMPWGGACGFERLSAIDSILTRPTCMLFMDLHDRRLGENHCPFFLRFHEFLSHPLTFLTFLDLQNRQPLKDI